MGNFILVCLNPNHNANKYKKSTQRISGYLFLSVVVPPRIELGSKV